MTALSRLKDGYYNSAPISEANPGGLAADGHQSNFPAALQDVGAVAQNVGQSVEDATAAAAAAAASAAECEGFEATAGDGASAANASAIAAAASAAAAAASAAQATGGGLAKAQNLADLPNKATARVNLQLGAEHDVTFNRLTVAAGDPTQANHAATKQYVDNLVAGLDVKQSVVTTNAAGISVDLATPGLNIGTVALNIGDRVLLREQANPADNGIWIWNGASTVMSRAPDMDSWAEVPGAMVVVEKGAFNDRGFVCTSNQGGTMGVTAISWTIFMGTGAYQAASNLLANFAALGLSAGKGIYATGADTFGAFDTSAFMRGAMAAVDGAAARAAIGAGTGDGYIGVPGGVQNAAYTLALSDQGKHLLHDGGSVVTYTIPLNSAVPFPIGTVVAIVNNSTFAVTVAGTAGVNIVQAGTGSTGSRTVGAYGMVSMLKVGTDRWFLSGAGLS